MPPVFGHPTYPCLSSELPAISFSMSNSCTALSKSTGMEIAYGNGNIHYDDDDDDDEYKTVITSVCGLLLKSGCV